MIRKSEEDISEMLGTFHLLLGVIEGDAQTYLDAGEVDFTELLKKVRAAKKALFNVPAAKPKKKVGK